MCVKLGLHQCTTTYALVAQHDRAFVAPFPRVLDLLRAMQQNAFIRYIGFTSNSTMTHHSVLGTRYRLGWSEQPQIKLDLGNDLMLQPLIFWFDSQHLCHIQRYLDIYSPYYNLPEEMKSWLGEAFVKDMILRKGDPLTPDIFLISGRNILLELLTILQFFLVSVFRVPLYILKPYL